MTTTLVATDGVCDVCREVAACVAIHIASRPAGMSDCRQQRTLSTLVCVPCFVAEAESSCEAER